ncbi:Acetylesterase [Hypsizygus marmoreus]|uniref:Acetylesterase n=1 Tax=Hypsizygus marmoreus TaxID=39966 RepID=A0A369J846_HYPMA|nr:Acetylesterase [Hypsizygus marmoreus]
MFLRPLLMFFETAVFISRVFGQETQSTPSGFNWDVIKYVFASGDSYSFVQGTRGCTNFSFIGDALNLPFTPQELLTDEIIPKMTSSEGSNWLEYLTRCFSGQPSACPRQLWNFAFAGADIDKALLPLHHEFTVPLVDQVNQWATYASNTIPHPPAQTLTTWWIGINDTGDTVDNSTITDINAFWELEMTSYFNAVNVAYRHGLRNHLFLNVPPGERAPATVNNSTKAAIQRFRILQFNTILARHISSFAAAHTATFGFANVTGFCTCADPAGFFWYNSGHPTEQVHEVLAKAIEAQLHLK